MNILDLSGICIDSMRLILEDKCNLSDCDIFICDGKHFYNDVNIQLRTNNNHDNYILVFTVKD